MNEDHERLASASSQYKQLDGEKQVEKEETIYTAIEAANDKYGANSDEVGSGDKDPVDPAYGMTNTIYTVEPISTGYGVPRG